MNKKQLKKRSTFEELLNIVKDDKPIIQDLPNRFSTQIRESQKYQQLLNDDFAEINEHSQRIQKHNILQHEIINETENNGGNHQVNLAQSSAPPASNEPAIGRPTFLNIGSDDGDGYVTPGSAIDQDIRDIRDMVFPPPPDIDTVFQGITGAIQSANLARRNEIMNQFNNLAPQLQNNIASYMPQTYGTSSSSGYQLVQESQPMDVEPTRGRSRTRSGGGESIRKQSQPIET